MRLGLKAGKDEVADVKLRQIPIPFLSNIKNLGLPFRIEASLKFSYIYIYSYFETLMAGRRKQSDRAKYTFARVQPYVWNPVLRSVGSAMAFLRDCVGRGICFGSRAFEMRTLRWRRRRRPRARLTFDDGRNAGAGAGAGAGRLGRKS